MAATLYVSFKQVLFIGSIIFYILAPIQGDNVPVYDDNGKNTGDSWGALGKSQFQHVSAHPLETVEILFKRSKRESSTDFHKYEIFKNNYSIITLGKEEDGKKFFCKENAVYTATCRERFSFGYINSTNMALQIRNITSQGAGHYSCQAYFTGANKENDPQYEHVYLIVQDYATVPSTLASTATSDHSDYATVPSSLASTATSDHSVPSSLASTATSDYSGHTVPATSAFTATRNHSGCLSCFVMLAMITTLQALVP